MNDIKLGYKGAMSHYNFFLTVSSFSAIHPPPPQFSETGIVDVPEFEDVGLDAHSPEIPASEWGSGNYTGPDSPDGQNVVEYYSNGINTPSAEVHPAAVFGDQNSPYSESSLPVLQETPPADG